jgi:hypothetical protein
MFTLDHQRGSASMKPKQTGPFAGKARADWQTTNGKAGPAQWRKAATNRKPPFPHRVRCNNA